MSTQNSGKPIPGIAFGSSEEGEFRLKEQPPITPPPATSAKPSDGSVLATPPDNLASTGVPIGIDRGQSPMESLPETISIDEVRKQAGWPK